MYGDSPNLPILRMPWEDPATAFRSAGHVIPPEIAAKKAAAALAEAQVLYHRCCINPALAQVLSWLRCHFQVIWHSASDVYAQVSLVIDAAVMSDNCCMC